MTCTIFFDKGRRFVTVERSRLIEEIERLTAEGHVISSVQ